MSGETPRLKLAELPESQSFNAAEINALLGQLDLLVDCRLKGVFVNASPGGASDGDIYLVGASPSGDWGAEYAYKLAYRRDGAWDPPVTPFDGMRAFVPATNAFLVCCGGAWTDWNALIGAAESNIASAATCDIGAAASLFLAVTGTTTITSFGTVANRLRFLRFAGALTLTHNATALVLPGAANIVTAAGDTALFASDGSGNWRCRFYARADGRMVNMASPVFSGTATFNAAASGANFRSIDTLGSGTGAAYGRFQNTGGQLLLGVESAAANQIVGGSTAYAGVIGTPGNIPLQLFANNTIGPTVNTNGTFTVGTNATGWNSSNTRIESKGVIALSGWCSNAGDIAVQARCDNAGGYAFAAYYGASLAGTISYSGGGAGVAYNTTSDARLKTVRPRQQDHRAAIRALWVGDFTWTQSGAPGFGVLAQQAWEVMPNHQGVTRPADDGGTWHASAEPFGHLALWGVKDLYAMVEALTARVAALEAAHHVA